MKTSWNDEEDDALQGLPLRAQIMYLRGIRRYMDYSTRISGGHKRRISLAMLSEIVEEYINRAMQDKPTKHAVRAAIEQLKRAGLIERIEDKDYLIFFLPLADTNESVQINNRTTTAQQPHRDSRTVERSNDAIYKEHNRTTTAHVESGNNRTHQVSGNQDKDSLLDEVEKPKAATKKQFAFPDWLNQSAWQEFEQHRKEIKKSLSDLSRTKAINRLYGLSASEQQEIIDYSIEGKYPGLYPERITQKSPNSATNRNSGFQKQQRPDYSALWEADGAIDSTSTVMNYYEPARL